MINLTVINSRSVKFQCEIVYSAAFRALQHPEGRAFSGLQTIRLKYLYRPNTEKEAT